MDRPDDTSIYRLATRRRYIGRMDLRRIINANLVKSPSSEARMRARVLDHMVRVSVSVIEHMRRGFDGLPWNTAADEIAALYLNAMAEAIDEAFGAPKSLSVWVFRQCLKDRNLSRVHAVRSGGRNKVRNRRSSGLEGG